MGAIKDWENQNLWHHKDPKEIFVRDLNSKRYFSLPGLVKRICLQPQVTIQASSATWSSLFSCNVSLLRHQRSQLQQVECREEFAATILRQQNKFDCQEKDAFLQTLMCEWVWFFIFLFFCFYKYHQGKLGDIKAPRHLIIERCMAGGRCEDDADSWLLLLRNNDAPEQTVGPGHGRRVCAEAGILRKTSEAQWQEHSARENPV